MNQSNTPASGAPPFSLPNRTAAITLAGLLLVIGAACQTTGPPPASTSGPLLAIDVPSPLTGPGRDAIEPGERKAVENAWGDLLSGRVEEAKTTVFRFSSPQAELLRLQIDLYDGPTTEIQDRLEAFVGDHSQYAAGWATLSSVAESNGNESLALRSAQKSTRLWPSGPFSGRANDLESRWVTARIENAGNAVAEGRPMDALPLVEQALDLEPDNQDGLLVRAEALVQLQQGPEAEAALSRLGTLPDALLLRAELASDQGHWQRAMDLLGGLPDDHPAKERALRRAQLMWRMSILPPYVQEAVASSSVTREQLAVILVAMVPSLEIEPGGQTPLMTDIIDLPSQRAILATARLDVLSVDRVARRFHPTRTATVGEVRSAVESVCHLAGFSPPLWCEAEMDSVDSCIQINDPVDGETLVEILLAVNVKADI